MELDHTCCTRLSLCVLGSAGDPDRFRDHDQNGGREVGRRTMISEKSQMRADHSSIPPALTLGLGLSPETPSLEVDDHIILQHGGESIGCVHRQASSLITVDRVSSFSNCSSTILKKEKDQGSWCQTSAEKFSSRKCDDDDDYEEGGGGHHARKKLRLTKEQSMVLEDSFKEHSTLNPKQKQGLAKRLKLNPRQVEVWFQNRRARIKLKQTEVDCELLKKCYETLTVENRRLLKQVQELKLSLGLEPIFCMQLPPPPPATLSFCPSCGRIPAGVAVADNSSKISFQIGKRPHFYDPTAHTFSNSSPAH